MRRAGLILATIAAGAALAVAGCGDDDEGGGGRRRRRQARRPKAGKVAVLLPDSKSSVRWETVDRPFLQQAFEAAGVEVEIQNAEGDKSTQQQQAEQAITNGAKVLLLVNLDSGSGAAIAANAKSQGVKVIDYDRLTLDGDSDYYVSFDNEKVGQLQGQGLVDCIEANGVSKPADRRAQRLADRQQRDAVQEGLRLGHQPEVRRRASGRRSPTSPCRLGQPEGADDLRADAAEGQQQGRRRARGQRRPRQRRDLGDQAAQARPDPGHRPGRDAAGHPEHRRRRPVHDGLQGDQEGGRRGRQARHRAGQGRDRRRRPAAINNGTKDVPSVFEEPVAVTKDNIGEYLGEPDFPKKEEICAGKLASACEEAGI